MASTFPVKGRTGMLWPTWCLPWSCSHRSEVELIFFFWNLRQMFFLWKGIHNSTQIWEQRPLTIGQAEAGQRQKASNLPVVAEMLQIRQAEIQVFHGKGIRCWYFWTVHFQTMSLSMLGPWTIAIYELIWRIMTCSSCKSLQIDWQPFPISSWHPYFPTRFSRLPRPFIPSTLKTHAVLGFQICGCFEQSDRNWSQNISPLVTRYRYIQSLSCYLFGYRTAKNCWTSAGLGCSSWLRQLCRFGVRSAERFQSGGGDPAESLTWK